MEEEYLKRVMSGAIIFLLVVLSFFIIKPILMAIILGLLLSFIFLPVYNYLYKKTKLKNLSATIVVLILALLAILPIWFFTPIVIEESFKFYVASQQIDFRTPLKNIFPDFFASDQFSEQIGSVLYSFVTETTNSLMNSLSDLIFNFPTLALQSIVVFFVFYFSLRDQEKIISYVKSLLPFPKEIEKKLFDSSKSITISVIYGQIVIGLLQGLIVGLSFFIFSVPNPTLLTLLAGIAGVFPIVGPTIIWVPVSIYMIIANNAFAAAGIIIFGLIASFADNFLRPIFVSKRTNIPSALVLVGMIGGLFFLGIIGLILGPLILAYLLIILELYRNQKSSFQIV